MGSPEISVDAPPTPAPMNIDLNTTPVGGGSSSGGSRKRSRELPADAMEHARSLFDTMLTAEDEAKSMFMAAGVAGAMTLTSGEPEPEELDNREACGWPGKHGRDRGAADVRGESGIG